LWAGFTWSDVLLIKKYLTSAKRLLDESVTSVSIFKIYQKNKIINEKLIISKILNISIKNVIMLNYDTAINLYKLVSISRENLFL